MVDKILLQISQAIHNTLKPRLPYPWDFCRLQIGQNARLLVNSGTYFVVFGAFAFWFTNYIVKQMRSLSSDGLRKRHLSLAIIMSLVTSTQLLWPILLSFVYFTTCSFYPWFSALLVFALNCPGSLTIMSAISQRHRNLRRSDTDEASPAITPEKDVHGSSQNMHGNASDYHLLIPGPSSVTCTSSQPHVPMVSNPLSDSDSSTFRAEQSSDSSTSSQPRVPLISSTVSVNHHSVFRGEESSHASTSSQPHVPTTSSILRFVDHSLFKTHPPSSISTSSQPLLPMISSSLHVNNHQILRDEPSSDTSISSQSRVPIVLSLDYSAFRARSSSSLSAVYQSSASDDIAENIPFTMKKGYSDETFTRSSYLPPPLYRSSPMLGESSGRAPQSTPLELTESLSSKLKLLEIQTDQSRHLQPSNTSIFGLSFEPSGNTRGDVSCSTSSVGNLQNTPVTASYVPNEWPNSPSTTSKLQRRFSDFGVHREFSDTRNDPVLQRRHTTSGATRYFLGVSDSNDTEKDTLASIPEKDTDTLENPK